MYLPFGPGLPRPGFPGGPTPIGIIESKVIELVFQQLFSFIKYLAVRWAQSTAVSMQQVVLNGWIKKNKNNCTVRLILNKNDEILCVFSIIFNLSIHFRRFHGFQALQIDVLHPRCVLLLSLVRLFHLFDQ